MFRQENSIADTLKKANAFYKLGKYKKAFDLYYIAAKKGNPDAARRLSDMYSNGLGVEKNEDKANKWSNRAFSYCVPRLNWQTPRYFESFMELGYIIDECKTAANSGNAQAQFNLGVRYANGQGVNKNDREAFGWLQKAALQGHIEAQYSLGLMYANGCGTAKSEALAFDWYKKAALHNNVNALNYLGLMYLKGQPEKNNVEAHKCFKKAAERGHRDAQFNFAYTYDNGLGIEKNEAKAFEWYEKAALQESVIAQYCLALMYLNGRGVIKNDDKAFKLFEKNAKNEHRESEYYLGHMYENGLGTEKNVKEAFKWYKKSALQEDRNAQHILGVRYANGECVKKNDDKAFMWIKKAALQEHVYAQHSLGLMYANGRGRAKNETKAAGWYQKAALNGHVNAQYDLALMYLNGRGVKKNDKEAFKFFEMAAKKEHREAQYYLGHMYDKGVGIEKNEKEAFDWYEKSASHGDIDAEFVLGMKYYYGHPDGKDDNEAAKWLKRAAVKKHKVAQNILGSMYYYGRGVKQSTSEAAKWYFLSAELGNQDAKGNLLELYKTRKITQETTRIAAENEKKRWIDEKNDNLEPQDDVTAASYQFESEVPLRANVFKKLEEKKMIILPSEINGSTFMKSGAFSEVYRGDWQETKVALKQLLVGRINLNVEELFCKEVELMLDFNHSNIVQLYGIAFNPYCLIMEYMSKGSLDELLHSKETINDELRFRLSLNIAEGVAYLHRQNIIHCDIKSPNILLNENYVAKLADFGMSKSIMDRSTFYNGGTTRWKAPELFTETNQNTKECDVYSYGIVVWEILSRQLPYQRFQFIQQIEAFVLSGERETIPSDAPALLMTIVSRSWAQNPEDRYSMIEISDVLRQACPTPNVVKGEIQDEPIAKTEVVEGEHSDSPHDSKRNDHVSEGHHSANTGSSSPIARSNIDDPESISVLESQFEESLPSSSNNPNPQLSTIKETYEHKQEEEEEKNHDDEQPLLHASYQPKLSARTASDAKPKSLFSGWRAGLFGSTIAAIAVTGLTAIFKFAVAPSFDVVSTVASSHPFFIAAVGFAGLTAALMIASVAAYAYLCHTTHDLYEDQRQLPTHNKLFSTLNERAGHGFSGAKSGTRTNRGNEFQQDLATFKKL